MKLGWCPARRLMCTLSTEARSSGTCTAFQFRESLTEALSARQNEDCLRGTRNLWNVRLPGTRPEVSGSNYGALPLRKDKKSTSCS